MGNTACFIDGGYFQKTLKKFFGRPKVDYAKLVERIRGDGQLLRTYYYDCKSYVSYDSTEEELQRQDKQEKFFYRLQRLPQFECKFGKLKRYFREDGSPIFVQKQVDVMMSIDLTILSLKHLITHAKIITGDADFIPAIQQAKSEGVVVELFYAQGCVDNNLLSTVDISTEITQKFIDKVTDTEA